MTKIAKLDAQGRLIGTRSGKPKADDVVLPDNCDLPLDGTYKWMNGAFWPLGHGFERITTRAPVSESQMIYMLATAMREQLPKAGRDWIAWYEDNLKQREEETAAAVFRRGPRR